MNEVDGDLETADTGDRQMELIENRGNVARGKETCKGQTTSIRNTVDAKSEELLSMCKKLFPVAAQPRGINFDVLKMNMFDRDRLTNYDEGDRRVVQDEGVKCGEVVERRKYKGRVHVHDLEMGQGLERFVGEEAMKEKGHMS